MGRLSARYDPRRDSSPRTEAWRPGFRGEPDGFDGLILDHRAVNDQRVCPCGCRQIVTGRSRFRMGHDMTLKGKLIRAHLTDTPVMVLRGSDDGFQEDGPIPAAEVAKDYSTDKLDWVEMLAEAERRQGADLRARIDRANREVLARAMHSNPRIGDRRLLRVGRWDYTGQVVAIYSLGDGTTDVEIEYVTKKGECKTVRRPGHDHVALTPTGGTPTDA